jgi:hypothetical protein
MWTVRARNMDLSMSDHVQFSQLSLVERYNSPDTCVLQGRSRDLAALMVPGMGAVLYDGNVQRVSGVVTEITRNGDRTGQVTITSDLVRLWDRLCYPSPTLRWFEQTAVRDTRTGALETVLLGFINANAGPGAIAARQVPGLRVPVSAGRGGATTVGARFNNLGQLAATLAERANLRVRVVHAATPGTTPLLNVVLEDAPDLSAWARYGTPNSGGPGMLAPDWEYGIGAPTVTRAEVAAGGEGAARILEEQGSPSAETLWGRRIESFVDQRQTTDVNEIGDAGFDALNEGVGSSTVQVKIRDSAGLRIGQDVPVGARVSASLDGLRVTERVREVTTTVALGGDSATVTVEPVFGTADGGGQTKTQAQLARILRRISVIERAL